MHIRYPKIHRLGKDETDGILLGRVVVQEKLDGANASVWLDPAQPGTLQLGSRSRHLPPDESFRGLRPWADSHAAALLDVLNSTGPGTRLYGEWLVKHTVHYQPTAYDKFYLFDIYDETSNTWLEPWEVELYAVDAGIPVPNIFDVITNPTLEQVQQYVGCTVLGDGRGEGIVLRNEQFVNKFGDRCLAKETTNEFKERNAIVFGGNNRHADNYWEVYVVNKYMTLARVKKVMTKIAADLDRDVELQDTPRVVHTAHHDMLTEEIWEIAKRVPKLDFKALSRLATMKAKEIMHDVLKGFDSVAYQTT